MKKFKGILCWLLAMIIVMTPVSITANAANEQQLRDRVLSVAAGEVGYVGTRSYCKYGEWYGWQGAWCTTFAIWCFNEAGEQMGVKLYGKICPLGGNCNSMIAWFRNKGRYHPRTSGYTPQKGDFVFFDWSGNGSAQHVGIVRGTQGKNVLTVEGNANSAVKNRIYTTTGRKPYKNVSAILGYGNPNWSSVANGKGEKINKKTTTKKSNTQTTRPQTTKKQFFKKKQTTIAAKPKTTKSAPKQTTKESTKAASTSSAPTTTTTTAPTTTTEPIVMAEDMTIYAPAKEMEVGDSVKLDYRIKPLGASAVVDYYCDEENIIEIKEDGTITATGEGTATVVVCANDEIYKQWDFTVSDATSNVTKHTPDEVNTVPVDNGLDYYETTKMTPKKANIQKLNQIGVDVEKLESHQNHYIIPVSIISATAAVALSIIAIKRIAAAMRERKAEKEITE
ncbi:MAG: CHAP domain-containing protein [Eubacterium sp.]|nr:CHAP domain-containing protein [Eubacterium sp.]